MHHDPASLPVIPVLKHIYTLPRPQCKPALLNWDRELSLRQGCLDMRWHIVGSFCGMAVGAILRCDVAKIILQVEAYIRVGIFLNGERC